MNEPEDYPMAGQTLGLWRLVRGIGRGGMGEVYEAEYDFEYLLANRFSGERRERVQAELRQLSRVQLSKLASETLGTPLPAEARFAIKVCNARSGTAGHRRFLQEAALATRLGDHPYIVSVHAINGGIDETGGMAHRFELDRGRYRDVAFMVMDLATPRYDIAKLSVGEAVHMVRCIATALDHAHGKGVVHRDLKPENILGTVAHPMLTDFGIAKEVDHEEGLTRTGQIIGTLDYMSPEQATDAKRVDLRSDIYSLGVVLYEYATRGRLPWAHKGDRDSCLAAIRSPEEDPRWPREHLPDFPVALERIILKATAHFPQDRYQAMPELIADLDRFSRGEWLSFWGRVRFRSWVRFEVRRHPRLVWGGLAVALCLLVLTIANWVPQMLDPGRRNLEGRIARLEAQAQRIAAREPDASQLRLSDRQALDQVRTELRNAGNSYPDLAKRLTMLDGTLLRHSRLSAVFSGKGILANAQTELTTAGRVQNAAWSLDSSGLRINENLSITLAPFGRGEIYARVVVQLPAGGGGFRMEVREADDPRHLAAWRLASPGSLQLAWREDLRPVQVLRTERCGEFISVRLHLAANGLRAWFGKIETSYRLPGPAQDAPCALRIDLPKGATVHQIIVWPELPPEP